MIDGELEKAKQVAKAIEWSEEDVVCGDMTVNWHTAIKAAKVLADRVEELESEIQGIIDYVNTYDELH